MKYQSISTKATILILLLQFLSNEVFAQKVYVNKEASLGGNGESWETAYKYLIDGLKESGNFDTIWVAKGIYYPDESELNYATDNDPTSYFSFFSKQLKIFGGFSGNETQLNQRNETENLTILSGDIEQNDVTDSNGITPDTSSVVGRNSYNIFYWYGGSTPQMTIDGFVFTGGFADGDFSEESIEGTETGGGLSNSWRANGGKTEVILKNLNFIGNYGNYGASMYIYNGEGEASFVIDSCNFQSNASSHSIVRLTGYYSEFVPELNNLKFLDNSGNALHLDLENTIYDNRTFYLQNSSFINNQRAVNIDADGYTKLLFNYLEIVNNQTGIYLNNIARLHLDIYNSKLINNQTGLNFSNQNFFESSIHNTIFSSHDISISLGNDGSPNPIEIGNCTFVENDQSISSFGADVNLKNSIVYGYQIDPNNQFSFTFFGEIYVANSIIKGSGGSTNWNSVFGTDGGNNLDTDPLFVNVYGSDSVIGSTDDDYRIGGFSPAVDNGSNSFVSLDKYDFNNNGDSTEILPYDLYLNPRISTFKNTNIVDMGAFEFGNNIEIVNVNISDTVQTFDNTPKEVSAQANLNDLNIVIYYNDQSSLPTDAGTYSIIAFINEIDYYGADTAQLIIEKAEGLIEVTDLEQVYDGTAKSVSVNTTPSDLNSSITYDGSASQPTNAGTYQVIVTIDEQNYEGADTVKLIIEKAGGLIEITDLEQVYDGTAKSISVSTTPSDLNTSITYDGSASPPTNAGIYQVIVTIDEQNYEGADTVQLIIEKAEGLIEITDLEQVYDGTAKSVSVNTTPSGLDFIILYDGSTDKPVEIGEYIVIVKIEEANYYGTATDVLLINSVTGINDEKLFSKIFPNPSSKELKIKVDDIILYLEIIDGNGKTVLTLTPHQSELSLDISDLKTGVYFLMLGTFDERVVKRVIKY
ncbi:MAG: T9SS type A sorting domain-containing protein [Cyclobacteriaceae bacterium]|nr:T9SS type A sorting domain-containing protein [Cyclobacteriaceae bacterium SS2]